MTIREFINELLDADVWVLLLPFAIWGVVIIIYILIEIEYMIQCYFWSPKRYVND